MQDFQLGLELSFAPTHRTPTANTNSITGQYSIPAYEEYASSPSFVSTTSTTSTSSECSCCSTATSRCGAGMRNAVVMVHNPYSFDAFTYMHRVVDGDADTEATGDDSDEGSDAEEEVSPTSSKQKKPKKKNVRCPNGHRASKRLRYRKGQSHYSCNECTIRWKVDDPKRRPSFVS